ncbi:MAG TPA: hypothetical protein VN894_16335 [Polyangiaceae bacterium]|nr:hypothetical protein [Polyangiaceae bacterium]
MATIRLVAMIVVVGATAGASCNQQRKQECDKFLAAMKPLDEGTPSAEVVDRVRQDVQALNLEDQPLHIYATNYQNTLTVLSSTLRLKADPSAPDGTDEVIKTHLKEARTDRDDVGRYCAQ